MDNLTHQLFYVQNKDNVVHISNIDILIFQMYRRKILHKVSFPTYLARILYIMLADHLPEIFFFY